MTLEEKRRKVVEYCSDRLCVDCMLKVGGWTIPVGGDKNTACPGIDLSPEADLDRAIAIINGEDCICPTCCYFDPKYDDTECKDCKNHMRRDYPEYYDARIKWVSAANTPAPTKADPVNDPVNHPEHYTSGGIECIDAIKASMTPIEYAGFLKGQVLKYTWRYRLKGNPVQDLKKANFYLDRLIHLIENEEVTL